MRGSEVHRHRQRQLFGPDTALFLDAQRRHAMNVKNASERHGGLAQLQRGRKNQKQKT